MQEVKDEGLNLTQFYYSEITGVIVYFRKRWNQRYDAHDAVTDERLVEYRNLTLETILRAFRPYKRNPVARPLATHLSDNLAKMSDEVGKIAEPHDRELNNRMKTFINTTQSNINALLKDER